MRADDDAGPGAFVLGGVLLAGLIAGAALLATLAPAPPAEADDRVEQAGMTSGCADAEVLFGLVCTDGG